MRKVTYGGAISLDGYLAGPNEEIDWLAGHDVVATQFVKHVHLLRLID